MARILILYATREGHTARVAEHVATALRDAGHWVDLRAAGAGLELAGYDGLIVGASVHYGRHPGHLRALLRKHCASLAMRPSAFFSVSLSAARPRGARHYVEAFLRQTGWRPQLTATFAGALQYSKYGALTRLLMTLFVGVAGGDTDTSRDYDYTDWQAVRCFSEAFARLLET